MSWEKACHMFLAETKTKQTQKRKMCRSQTGCQDSLEDFVAAAPSAETKEGHDKRSCKQSADQLSNTCTPCPQQTYGERLGNETV